MDKNTLQIIKKIMFEKNINQSDLARNLGITRSVISSWFSGVRNPKRENIEKIAQALEVPISKLLGEEISVISLNAESTIKLPVLSVVNCGSPDYCDIDETVIDDFVEIPKALFPESNFIVQCQGESMLPDIPPKAYCVIKKMDTALNNKIMLVKTEQGFTIKKVVIKQGKTLLEYLNPQGKTIEPKELTIIGRVLGLYTKF